MSASDYIIAIPSYKRPQICRDKTVAMLHKNKIPANKIYIYLANKEEKEEYEKVLDKSTYNELIVGIKGLVPQRQFIMSKWREGKHIVFFDDDIDKVDLTLSPKYRGKSFDYFIKDAFQECKNHHSFIWGVYPVFNPFFRKERDELTTCLNFIVGCFYGIINRPKLKAIQLTLTKENSQKEDSERTIKYFIHDGIVLRFNRIAAFTKFYQRDGSGLGTFEDRVKPSLEATKKLLKAFPEYGSISTRKSGMAEFKLRKIPAKNDSNNQTNTTKKNILNKNKKMNKKSKKNK
jgi:hypothetical protein